MLNFEVINPTRIVFGKDQLERLPQLINEFSVKKKILLAFGGGSIKTTGLFNKVVAHLKDFDIIEIDKLNTPGRNLFPIKYNILAKCNKNKNIDLDTMKFDLVD